MTPGERVARAQRAQELWGAFEGIVKEVREDLVKTLERSAVGDVDTHHSVALCLQNLTVIQSKIKAHIDDGTVAQAEQEQDNWIRRMRRKG